VPEALRNRLGIAIAKQTYKLYRDLLASARWQILAAAGAHPQTMANLLVQEALTRGSRDNCTAVVGKYT